MNNQLSDKDLVLLGQILAFAKVNRWDKVDETLHELHSELWLTVELNTLEDVEEFIYAAGYDIYSST